MQALEARGNFMMRDTNHIGYGSGSYRKFSSLFTYVFDIGVKLAGRELDMKTLSVEAFTGRFRVIIVRHVRDKAIFFKIAPHQIFARYVVAIDEHLFTIIKHFRFFCGDRVNGFEIFHMLRSYSGQHPDIRF